MAKQRKAWRKWEKCPMAGGSHRTMAVYAEDFGAEVKTSLFHECDGRPYRGLVADLSLNPEHVRAGIFEDAPESRCTHADLSAVESWLRPRLELLAEAARAELRRLVLVREAGRAASETDAAFGAEVADAGA